MPKTTIRFQILFALNALLGVSIAVFLAMDYQRQLQQRWNEKQIALEEEAKTLLPAVSHLLPEGELAVQRYVDAVCHQMQDSQSPGHHIVIQLGDRELQATAHHRASSLLSEAMKGAASAPTNYATISERELVVGSSRRDDISVYVSEEAGTLRASVFRDEVRRYANLLILVGLAAVVVNLVLIRIVARPIDRLVATVRQIAREEFGEKSGNFQSIELNYLASEIDTMRASLAAAKQHRELEMQKAKKIQQNLLPAGDSVCGMQLSHVYEPATEVAGDYFDVIDLNSAGCLLCIADVTGHGVPAAMSAAMLKTLLGQAVKSYSDPAAILDFINATFVDVTLDEDFATMLLVRYEPRSMQLQYASAGHETGWLLGKAGQLRDLKATGVMLGIDSDVTWESVSMKIEPGDRLFAYTDGLPEMSDAQDACLGRTAMPELFVRFNIEDVRSMTEAIRKAAYHHRGNAIQQDDLTFFVAEFGEQSANDGEA